MSGTLAFARLGRVPYGAAWRLQSTLAAARRYDQIPDALLLLEHPHTYTLGRRSTPDKLLWSADQLARKGVSVFDADRGGDITYHGPGQLVGYPILKRSSARSDSLVYLRALEEALVTATQRLGIAAERKPRYSGVWVGDEKICALGVKVDAYGITTHGFALNVDVDLSYFEGIVPCGIREMGVTSVARAVKHHVPMEHVVEIVTASLMERFDYERCIPGDDIPELANYLREVAAGAGAGD